MILLVLYLLCVLAALAVAAAAAYSDVRRMNVSNLHSLIVAALFFPAWAAAHIAGADVMAGLGPHLMTGGIVLAVTMVMFFMRLMGGADSKLAAAYALWAGGQGVSFFLLSMAFAGAGLSAAALLMRKYKPFKSFKEGSWVARVQGGEAVVPYAVALFIGIAVAFIKLGMLSPARLQSFIGG